jgi:hypothetical protein
MRFVKSLNIATAGSSVMTAPASLDVKSLCEYSLPSRVRWQVD